MKNTPYGKNLRLYIDGGSHDEYISAVFEGFPSGFEVNTEKLRRFMFRRAPGRSELTTERRESDDVVFMRGLVDVKTNGDTIVIRIYNTDARPSDYNFTDTPRPSHADYTATVKYGPSVDLRGGGHFSGRLTAPLCAIGGICLQYLVAKGIYVFSHLNSVSDVKDTPFDMASVGEKERQTLLYRDFPVLDAEKGELMRHKIAQARDDGDSVGGVVECAVTGLSAGLGEHMFASAEARISSAVFAVGGVKGIEFGSGFDGTHLTGSENNDAFYTDGATVMTKTNNCGGILGGMTDGMPMIFRTAIKPTPSIAKEQSTVSLSRMENVKIAVSGRHDPCIALRALPAIEAAAAVAMTDMLFDLSGSDKKKENETLSCLRNEIDGIDRELTSLFCRRMNTAEKIGLYKKKNGIAVRDEKRELELLDRVSEYAKQKYTAEVRELYERILELSRKNQTKITGGSK